MGGIIFWILIAILYTLSLIPFVLKRDWPSVLISLGAVFIIAGNIWAAIKNV